MERGIKMLQLNDAQIAKWRENIATLIHLKSEMPPIFYLLGDYLGINLYSASVDLIIDKVENYLISDKRFDYMESPFEIAASMVNKLTYIPYEDALLLVCERAELRTNEEFLRVLDCYLETGLVAWDAFE
jgi:hypothetical protein